ncbi:MAG: CoA transferase, partial [Chloroflexi bacterium]|nr:CoA transferase [Chloroflexota bacterium]
MYPLKGIRVVALEQAVAAPLASRHLADLGADVIKIERPGAGDFARRYDSSVHGLSSYFVWCNRGKRSLTLDIKQPAGREILEKLLDTADVFLTNLTQAALQRAELTPVHVRAARPRLVACAISGYGASGPYRDRRAYDLLLQGESGILLTTGTEDQPAKTGISLCDISAGMYAAMSTLGALLGRA